MKKIVGLDIGTNSIGWAIIEYAFDKKTGKIIDAGSRILPMDQGSISDFNRGILESATKQRTFYRGVRRLIERKKLRRTRLLWVLDKMGCLPDNWNIDHLTSIAYAGGHGFWFTDSHKELVAELQQANDSIINVPHDWTLYYLRTKALTQKISKEELAWVLLSFNQKRGYFELKDENLNNQGGSKYFFSDYVESIEDTGEWVKKKKELDVTLKEGITGKLYLPYLPDWEGKKIDFIVTERKLKNGPLKVTFSKPDENDWTLRKKRTESQLVKEGKTVAQMVLSAWKENTFTKIRGKEIHTIDRSFYRDELIRILDTQSKFHPELTDSKIIHSSAEELYKKNIAKQNELKKQTLSKIITDDILFYQRPLKTKTHLINDCKHEKRWYKLNGELANKAIKAAAKSHPAFQEYRIWSLIHNLKVIAKKSTSDSGALIIDNVMGDGFLTLDQKIKLFEKFDTSENISEKNILQALGLRESEYKTTHGDVKLKGNETKSAFIKAFKKADCLEKGRRILSTNKQFIKLWNLLYSHRLKSEKQAIINALQVPVDSNGNGYGFDASEAEVIASIPLFKKEYGSFSVKALHKLLPFLRCGDVEHFEKEIDSKTANRIQKIIDGEVDETISDQTREMFNDYDSIEHFRGIPSYLAEYLVYDRHSERSEIQRYESHEDIKRLKQHSLRNPIVEKVVNETLMVMKDIWSTYGRPDEIHIELGREMKNNAAKRLALTENRDKNEQTNQRIKLLLQELMNDPTTEGDINPFSIGQSEILKLYEEGAIVTADKNKKEDEAILGIYNARKTPSAADIRKYRLWLEQKYVSPYTGQIIPLSRLFTKAYEIEHVIPKAKYYDDSFSNKVICEAAVNKDKKDRTAYEWISADGGKTIQLGHGGAVQLLSKEAYEAHVQSMFSGKKLKLLLSHDVPEGFISRQLNDTRYISRKVMELLDPIVRGAEDTTSNLSPNVVPIVGRITSDLKKAWGLNDVWKSLMVPRFERLNRIHNTDDYCKKVGNDYHLKYDLQGGLKRIDHRHHALDAIAIACISRQHTQYLQSLSNDKIKYKLEPGLMQTNHQGKKQYLKPWDGFTAEAKQVIDDIIVSFKYNNRVINKTKNYIQKWNEDGSKKISSKQASSNNHWSIRKALHKESVYGRFTKQEYKTIRVAAAFEYIDQIADRQLKQLVIKRYKEYGKNITKAKKSLKTTPINYKGEDVQKLKIIVPITDRTVYASKRAALGPDITRKVITTKVCDPHLAKILEKHLDRYKTKVENKDEYKDHPDLAFSEEGIEDLNSRLKIPVYKISLYEDMGLKRPIGSTGNKGSKYVESAKGTNLFFVIYVNNETGEHLITKDSSISFIQAMQLIKDGLPICEHEEGHTPMILSPGDLVTITNNNGDEEIYKMVSCTKHQCFFIPASISNLINFPTEKRYEFSSLNKIEKDKSGEIMVKAHCKNIVVNRLGKIVK